MFSITKQDNNYLVLSEAALGYPGVILETCKTKRLAMAWISYLNGGKHPFADKNGEDEN